MADRPVHFLNKLMVANMRLKGAHLILPKVDRMLGSQGMSPLSPLFDRDVIELSMRMPPQAKLHHGVEKWVLKQAYVDVLPTEVITRPKSGMRIPVHSWFQHELERAARDLLSPRAVRRAGVFDERRVARHSALPHRPRRLTPVDARDLRDMAETRDRSSRALTTRTISLMWLAGGTGRRTHVEVAGQAAQGCAARGSAKASARQPTWSSILLAVAVQRAGS